MWSDSRLVNMQGAFCLCTYCTKEQYPKIRCDRHRAFMKMTRLINIAAPVIACLDFESLDKENEMDKFYEPQAEKEKTFREVEANKTIEKHGDLKFKSVGFIFEDGSVYTFRDT